MARITKPLKGIRLATSGFRAHAPGTRLFLGAEIEPAHQPAISARMGRGGAIVAVIAVLLLLAAAGGGFSPSAADEPAATGEHMTVADPATLGGARAEAVYQAIRARLRQAYAAAGDPVTQAYQGWRRYNAAPYRSPRHGERFVNNYANERARRYGRFERVGALPEGAVVVKDSFVVSRSGQVLTGPFFLMEKKYRGFNPAARDWLFMMIGADGRLVGITGGRGSEKVAFCGACHNRAPRGQDGLWLLPKKARRP